MPWHLLKEMKKNQHGLELLLTVEQVAEHPQRGTNSPSIGCWLKKNFRDLRSVTSGDLNLK